MTRHALAGLLRRRVVVLPDIFTDAIVRLPAWPTARPEIEAVLGHGGGNLHVADVAFKTGGNAANLGLALARLGARVDLVGDTDAVGRIVLDAAAADAGLAIQHVKATDAASRTIALEFGGRNVMISRPGALAAFGPERLDARAWRLIESADAVAVTNWAQNRRGTQLLAAVASRLANGAFLFLDTGDPRPAGQAAMSRLLHRHDLWPGVGAWGMNENEVRAFTRAGDLPLQAAARRLAARLGCRIDVHRVDWAASVTATDVAEAYGRPTRARWSTGAGDAWNAGNLAGYLLRWPAVDRLRFAHKVARWFVSSTTGRSPTAAEMGLRGSG